MYSSGDDRGRNSSDYDSLRASRVRASSFELRSQSGEAQAQNDSILIPALVLIVKHLSLRLPLFRIYTIELIIVLCTMDH